MKVKRHPQVLSSQMISQGAFYAPKSNGVCGFGSTGLWSTIEGYISQAETARFPCEIGGSIDRQALEQLSLGRISH
jgi:hypothetical protein